ncbi:MAG: DEAD/DEAH box helicase [Eubacteriales bacterium]
MEQIQVDFKDLPLSSEMLQSIEAIGYEKATQIQSDAIPHLLEGKDVLGLSGTGTGKTAAFSIPILERLEDNGKKVQVLILCPTRELAMQISDEIRKFSRHKKGIRLATIYGGQAFQIQFTQLKTANIVVGTPGRVMDHMERGTLSLSEMKTIVLDEADEMLTMGFFEDIELILSKAPEERQTILFSATMPPAIMKATQKFQKDPVTVKVSKESKVQNTILQLCYDVPRGKKQDSINLLLQYHQPNRSIIFCNTKKMVDELVEYLNDHGFASEGLHGDMKQLQRTAVMRGYKQGKTKILVATDVAARGIDVENVEAVFNFDIPLEKEYYIHRVGRTGRAGKTGVSHTFICDKSQRYKVYDIQKHTGQKLEEKPLPTEKEILDKIALSHFEKFEAALTAKSFEENQPVLDKLLEAGYDINQIANMALETIIGDKKPKIPYVPPVKKMKPIATREQKVDPNRVRVRLNVGRAQKMLPNFIVGAFVEETDIPAGRIGDIKITNDYSDVEMSKEDALEVMSLMEGKKIRNKVVSLQLLSGGVQREERNFYRKNQRSGKSNYRGNFANRDRESRGKRDSKNRHEN